MIAKSWIAWCAMLVGLCIAPGVAVSGEKDGAAEDIPEGKKTSLGLYLTAAEAYAKWEQDPEAVKIIDVRTPEEYIFVGHAEMAWSIPLAFQTYEWNEEHGYFAIEPNPAFVDLVKSVAGPDETLLVYCRSGGRSAMAVDKLAEEGFTQVYTILDGMEGDKVKDPDSPDHGKRMKNGWKNSGAPWTYSVDPGRALWPEGVEDQGDPE